MIRCTTAQPNDELERVVHALAYDGVGCVVVVDGGRPIGVRLVSSRLVSSRLVWDSDGHFRRGNDADALERRRRLVRADAWMIFIKTTSTDVGVDVDESRRRS